MNANRPSNSAPTSAVLYGPSDVHSLRHAPSWMLLAASGGAVNAGALLACQAFVSHVTGTATRLGVDAARWTLALEYGLVLAAFIGGAMASVLFLQARKRRGLAPVYHVPMLVVAVLVVLVAMLGHAGVFGPFGTTVETPGDFAMLTILGFAMGLQNATVATTTNLAVRTTHMTGPASDLGVHLASAWGAEGEERRVALRGAALRGGKIAAFIVGGVVMLPVTRAGGYLAFIVPAAGILLATALSFVPRWHGVRAPAAQPAV